jgi:hypothetical protein
MNASERPESQFDQPKPSEEQPRRVPSGRAEELFARMHQVADDAARGVDIKAAEEELAPSFSVDGVEIISDGAREDEGASSAGFNDEPRSKRQEGQARGWLAEHEEKQYSVGEKIVADPNN